MFYVDVDTLIDTGSMTTFISNKIHNIDFESTLIDTTEEERCVSLMHSCYLTGSHARTEVNLSSLPKGKSVSGVIKASGVHAGGTPEACEGNNSAVLIQSSMKANIAVVLDQNVSVPATEMILEGRLVQSPKAEIGMIAPYSNDLDNDLSQR